MRQSALLFTGLSDSLLPEHLIDCLWLIEVAVTYSDLLRSEEFASSLSSFKVTYCLQMYGIPYDIKDTDVCPYASSYHGQFALSDY